VADPTWSVWVRETVGPSVPVEVGPTPELEEVRDFMMAAADAGGQSASYLEGGAIAPELIEDLFRKACLLWDVAPWEVMDDDAVVRLDIPGLDVNGACLSVIGALGEDYGVLIFPSIEAYESFRRAAEQSEGGELPEDFGTGWIALDFEDVDELSEPMRREVAEHGWPLADECVCPFVRHCDPDGMPRALEERDVRVAAAVAGAFPAFFVRIDARSREPSPNP
jgi:hypothetical protein